MIPTYEELKEIKTYKTYPLYDSILGGHFRLTINDVDNLDEDIKFNISIDYFSDDGYLSYINYNFKSKYEFSQLYKLNKKNYNGLIKLYKKMLNVVYKEVEKELNK